MNVSHPQPYAGPPASVPVGTRVYAVGDIHGRSDLLDRLLGDVCLDVRRSPAGRVVLVFLGDMVDRGPDSRGVVERLLGGPPADGPLAGAEWVCLRGNHEDYMLQFLADFSTGRSWLRNGGLEAVRSYAGSIPDGYATDHPALQRLLYRSMPPAHLRFLSRLPLRHTEGGYLFVHAGVRPGVPLDRQDAYDLMWIRDDFLFSDQPLGKVVVHGHTVVPVPEVRSNRIGIDTGAYRTGHLTCLVLEGTERRFLVT
jgi:serine/threonine protein phosphatase 1